MSSGQYKRELAQIEKDKARVQTDLGREEQALAKARAAAAQKCGSGQRSSSVSMRDSYLRQAESEDRKVEAAQKRIGALQTKLADLAGRQHSKEQSLRNAERSEQATRDRAEQSRRSKEKSEQDARDRVAEQRRRKEKAEQDARDKADAKRRQLEKSHAREVARLSAQTVHHVYIREPEPEKLRILYLTASPATPNVEGLRVDAEVNNVLKALRGAKHRELVEFQHRPAATIDDLVNGLNDLRPHVVHFSGHADGGLLLDTADPVEPGDQLVSYVDVARVLKATDQQPTVIVLNACRTQEGVEHMLGAAPVVVATVNAVRDASAAIFATHFYAAIAAAQSIGEAVDQARAMIAIALPDEPDTLSIRASEGIDPYEAKLVKPT